MTLNDTVKRVTETIRNRSHASRSAYMQRINKAAEQWPKRKMLSCGNLAHGFAACGYEDKAKLKGEASPNLGIVTSFNDMLSAHQPYETYPQQMKQAARDVGGTAQVAAGVPAMCDGVTQGQPGMELSLFSRDLIAMSAGIGLSHNMFDAAAYLGICDKIVPGLTIAAMTFGHLPSIFVPAGPMPSGLPNDEKAKTRQLYAEGKIGREALLESESASYHAPGTCTFYGTANSNQMLMEIMGLHLPGSSFINPGTPLRDLLTQAATKRALAITALGNEFTPVANVIDERAIVNGIVGLHATGGSTNHTLHIIAMAAAAGIKVTWEDFSELSDVVPLLTRIYPNGLADVNHFQAAGGMAYLVGELISDGLVHDDVMTVQGQGLELYTKEPAISEGELVWQNGPDQSGDDKVLRSVKTPFQETGGLKMLSGNLGQGVIKISAVAPERHVVTAPAIVFHSQEDFQKAFNDGKLQKDFIAVLRFQGPSANGMPELHKLTPYLGILQDKGFKVAMVTDGRMSGASGKVPAAIHLTPEAKSGGPIARIQDGDIITLDAVSGLLSVDVPEHEFASRDLAISTADEGWGLGRELFQVFRDNCTGAAAGANTFNF